MDIGLARSESFCQEPTLSIRQNRDVERPAYVHLGIIVVGRPGDDHLAFPFHSWLP